MIELILFLALAAYYGVGYWYFMDRMKEEAERGGESGQV